MEDRETYLKNVQRYLYQFRFVLFVSFYFFFKSRQDERLESPDRTTSFRPRDIVASRPSESFRAVPFLVPGALCRVLRDKRWNFLVVTAERRDFGQQYHLAGPG